MCFHRPLDQIMTSRATWGIQQTLFVIRLQVLLKVIGARTRKVTWRGTLKFHGGLRIILMHSLLVSQNGARMHRHAADMTNNLPFTIREGIQKKNRFFFRKKSQTMGGWGSRVLNLWKCENTRFLRNFWVGVKSPKLDISAMWVLNRSGGWVGSAV